MEVSGHLPEFDEELNCIEQFGDDEPTVEWGLDPAAAEDQDFEDLLDTA